MHWTFFCPGCDHPLQGRPGEEGGWASCPGCLVRFRVPDPATPYPGRRSSPLAGRIALGCCLFLVVGFLAWRSLGAKPARTRHPHDWPKELHPPRHGGPGRGRPPFFRRPADGLIVPQGIDAVLGRAAEPPPAMRQAGKIDPFVGLAFTADGRLLSATRERQLLLHDGQTYSLLTEVRLLHPLLFLELDEPRGLLHAVEVRQPFVSVNRMGEREPATGDLVTYDITDLLHGGKAAPKPVRRLDLGGNVVSLALSRDGNRLWCLVDRDGGGEALLLDAASLKQVGRQEIKGSMQGLCLPPNEERVYVLGGGKLLACSPDLKEVTDRVSVSGSMQCPVAVGGGIVLLAERRQGVQILAVKVASRRLVVRWTCPIAGHPTLARSPDGSRAYLAMSAVLNGRVWAIDCARRGMVFPALLGEARSTPESLLRGAAHVSPDGRFVVLGNGVVLKSGT